MQQQFEILSCYNPATGKSRYVKEYDNGRQVKINWRRFKKAFRKSNLW